MIETLLAYFLIAFIGAHVAAVAAVMAGSKWYDVRHQAKAPSENAPYPSFTVIIVAQNDAGLVTECLESVLANAYPHKHIVIVDNASTDTTKKQIKAIIGRQPQAAIRLLAKRKAASFHQVARQGLRLKPDSDLVLAIDGRSRLGDTTLRAAANRFRERKDIQQLHLNTRSLPSTSLFSLLHTFLSLARWQTAKLKALFQKQSRHVLYEDNCVVHVPAQSPLRKPAEPVSYGRWVLDILRLASVVYAFYLAYALESRELLLVVALATSGWLVFCVFAAERMAITTKLRLLAAVPAVCALLGIRLIRRLAPPVSSPHH